MPEMDGVSATAAITERDQRVRIVMFTAYDETSLALEAVHAGVAAVLVKGCTPAVLLAALDNARRGVDSLAGSQRIGWGSSVPESGRD
jgi:DNA-binding NarL/FixJ family response regulator